MATNEPEDEIPFPSTKDHDEAPINEHPWWTKPISEIIGDLLRPKGKK